MNKRYLFIAFTAIFCLAGICTPGFAGNNPAMNITGTNHSWQIIKAPLGVNASYEIRPYGSGQALVLHIENTTLKSHLVEVFYSLGTLGVFSSVKANLAPGQIMEGGNAKGDAPDLVIRLTPQQAEALKTNKPEFKIVIK